MHIPEDEYTRREAYEGNFEDRMHRPAIQLRQQFHERPIPAHSIFFEAFDCKPTRYQLPDIRSDLMTCLSLYKPQLYAYNIACLLWNSEFILHVGLNSPISLG